VNNGSAYNVQLVMVAVVVVVVTAAASVQLLDSVADANNKSGAHGDSRF